MNINFTDYIRTTDARHVKAAQHFWVWLCFVQPLWAQNNTLSAHRIFSFLRKYVLFHWLFCLESFVRARSYIQRRVWRLVLDTGRVVCVGARRREQADARRPDVDGFEGERSPCWVGDRRELHVPVERILWAANALAATRRYSYHIQTPTCLACSRLYISLARVHMCA